MVFAKFLGKTFINIDYLYLTMRKQSYKQKDHKQKLVVLFRMIQHEHIALVVITDWHINMLFIQHSRGIIKNFN